MSSFSDLVNRNVYFDLTCQMVDEKYQNEWAYLETIVDETETLLKMHKWLVGNMLNNNTLKQQASSVRQDLQQAVSKK